MKQIHLPSSNDIGELTRVFRLIQEQNTQPQVTVEQKVIKQTVNMGSASGGVVTPVHNSLSGRSDANAHPASSITNTPAGTISAITVQSALNELDTEKAPKASPTLTGTTTVDQLQFDITNPLPAFSSGQMYWNAAEGTVDLDTDITGTSLSLGQEQYVRVVNKTGIQINDGQVVYINGAQDNRPTVALARADSIGTSLVIGVATSNIANNAAGYITTMGIVRNYNTSGFLYGDKLYLSATTAGLLTKTMPTGAGIYNVPIATALNSTNNGSIFVHAQAPIAVDPAFTENTDLAPPSQKAVRSYVGHDITGEFTGFVEPDSVVVSYDSATRKVTLTGTVNGYYRGQKIAALTSGWVSDAHPVATAPYFLYYNGTAFVWSTTPWSFENLQIAFIAYTSGGAFLYGIRECHGLMQWQAHRELHETTGTYLKSGGDLSGYVLASNTAANRRPDVAATNVADEDLITLNSALTSKTYTICNLSGTGTTTFTIGASDILPVTGSQPFYNQFSSPNWVQTGLSVAAYTTVWCVAIPATADATSQNYRYIWIQGQSEGTLAQMRAVTFGSLNLGQLANFSPEFVPIAKLIIRYIGGNWTIESVEKLTLSRTSGVSSSGNFLSAVSTDASLTGAGTASSLLGINLSNANTWTAVTTFSNSTTSTSTTTGAVVVTGGIGVGGSVTVGSSLYIGDNADITRFFDSPSAQTATTIYARNPNSRTYEFGILNAAQTVWAFRTDVSGKSYFGNEVTVSANAAVLGSISNYKLETANAVSTNGQSIWDINANGMGVNSGIKFANTQLGGQTLGLAYLQWYRGSSQDRRFSVFVSDGSGNSIESMRLDGANSGNAYFYSSTASTSTTTGALLVTGGIGCGDYVTSKYRSSDGTAGLSATRTFYTASTSGGAVNVLNTVTIKDGIITAWTQA